MRVIPSLDLYDQCCVRLKGGKPDEMKVYQTSPVKYAEWCMANNMDYIHLVDLNRAFDPKDNTNAGIIAELVRIPGLRIQLGGGIDRTALAQEYIGIGVDKICIGSVVIRDPRTTKEIFETLGSDKVVVCVDYDSDGVVVNGWRDKTHISVEDVVSNAVREYGARYFLSTDIHKDGTLKGFSVEKYVFLKKMFPDICLISSGGCSSIDDLYELSAHGIDACVVGKALFENRIQVDDLNVFRFIDTIDFDKGNGLVPCIVQDDKTKDILMLAYADREAVRKTIITGNATFYSRSRRSLWIKGATTGNKLKVVNYRLDCDNDTLLLSVRTDISKNFCHLNQATCWGDRAFSLEYLDSYVNKIKSGEIDSVYTKSLLESGLSRCAQKVGEEAVETVIEAMKEDSHRLVEEAADLFFHIIVLLNKMDLSLDDVVNALKRRHIKK